MKEILNLLKELDDLTGEHWVLHLYGSGSGYFSKILESYNPTSNTGFISLEQCKKKMRGKIAKIKAENKKANTATYSMPELKEVQKLIDKLSEDIGKIFSS